MTGQWTHTKMAHKKAKIKNDPKEIGIDTIIKDEQGKEFDWSVKTVEAESDTKLEDDKGEGTTVTLRHFFFKPNPEDFKQRVPTAQELFNTHLKQIEIELWKDQWTPFPEVEPRLIFLNANFESVPAHDPKLEWYCFIIAALPAKGSNISYQDTPKTLKEIANESRRTKK